MARPDECTNYAKYVMWRAYLGEPNMAQWSIPENIIQNAVQMSWPHSQKLRQNQFFAWFPHCNYDVELEIASRFLFIF